MKSNTITDQQYYFSKFQQGDEKGLEFFYQRFYPSLYYRGRKFIKDEANAASIVSEAFLRVWLIRNSITDAAHIETFVRKRTMEGCRAYYKTSRNSFHNNMLRLDDIDNYQDFIGSSRQEEQETDTLYQQELDERMQKQWKQVEAVLPNLPQNQQLFIQLCLKYSFSYDRIAWHIGGISDYQVARTVEKTISALKSIISNTQKLNVVGTSGKIRFQGNLNEEQTNILNLRYQLQYSFEEIASELGLSQNYVQETYIKACLILKKVKN